MWNTLYKLAINIYTVVRRNDKISRWKKGKSKPIDRKQADREPGQIKRGHVNAFICRCMVLSRKISPPGYRRPGRPVIVFEESLHNASSIMRAHVPRTPNCSCIILQGRKDATISTMSRKKRANDCHKTT